MAGFVLTLLEFVMWLIPAAMLIGAGLVVFAARFALAVVLNHTIVPMSNLAWIPELDFPIIVSGIVFFWIRHSLDSTRHMGFWLSTAFFSAIGVRSLVVLVLNRTVFPWFAFPLIADLVDVHAVMALLMVGCLAWLFPSDSGQSKAPDYVQHTWLYQ